MAAIRNVAPPRIAAPASQRSATCTVGVAVAVAGALLLSPVPATADPARIVGAEARRSGDAWTVSVTLLHADTGWDDYADGWRVESPGGDVLGTRTLLHPHVDEQPFTRSLAGITVPDGVPAVAIRARTLTGGWGDATLSIPLPR